MTGRIAALAPHKVWLAAYWASRYWHALIWPHRKQHQGGNHDHR